MTPLLVVTVLCIVANVFIAVADYLKVGIVLKTSSEVHLPAEAVPYLAALKLTGALGLVGGLLAFPWLGVAAAAGLTLLFIGALIAHLRAKVYYDIAFPGLYLLLAVGALVHLVQLASGT
ncbi:DoxX family protein [Ornithinimicrobium faecis]|uniref:DoxX family protein n=1 Tax=Ornithinimicrobium faecis TaxID=2934158 RepID=A0ABY4YQ04_9MICO|nr:MULTISPECIES: DoxX family protein [unclassified Ornithinimicrobium]USQ78788.1 DoxX family protein [Ornithinimicrobium sp. HY1793]